MYELTPTREATLLNMKVDVAEKAEDLFNTPLRLFLFTYYPLTNMYGCTIIIGDKGYYGKGKNIDEMLNSALRSKMVGEYVVPATTLSQRQSV